MRPRVPDLGRRVSITGWLLVAVVCLIAGVTLLAVDRLRRRPRGDPPGPRPPEPRDQPPEEQRRDPPPDDPGSLFTPNTPP